MVTQVTVSLPDELYHRAEQFAQLTNRNVVEVLVEAITASLEPLGSASALSDDTLLDTLSDSEVLEISELQLPEEQDQRLSQLLDRQQEGVLSAPERSELWLLMQIYQTQLLRKAQALKEAVKRGLRQPLEA
jgi:hypothetical protein